MPDPAWLGYAFAAALMIVGGYSLARVAAVVPLGRRTHYDVNIGHGLMAIAMMRMLVPSWSVGPSAMWETAFGLLALWFLARAAHAVGRGGAHVFAGRAGSDVRHYLVHCVLAVAMLYMYWVGMPMPAQSGMVMGGAPAAGVATAGVPTVTLLFVIVLLASAVWRLNGIDRLVPMSMPIQESGSVLRPTAGAAELPGWATASGVPGGATVVSQPDERPWLAPRLEVGCHIAMCVAMAYMLVLVV